MGKMELRTRYENKKRISTDEKVKSEEKVQEIFYG